LERLDKISDIHVHLGVSSGIYRAFTGEDILKFKETFNIQKIVLMSFERNVEENNRTISELSQKYASVFGLYWIQKSRIDKDIIALEKSLNKKMIGVKFHGYYEGYPVSAKCYQPIMELLSQKQGILLVHTGRYKDGAIESNTSYLHAIDVARNYNKVKVIMAHMGGSDTTIAKKAIVDSKELSNVYFDTSGITTPHVIEYALKYIDSRKIIFGSDEPWCSFRSMYYNIIDANIDDDSKANILYESFNRLVE
jgi:predicted TIM-barrel fold metal-dependent hydrolase